MSRYILIRRLRGPAFLLLVGTLALLNQADILSWGKSWPFFLILWGVMALAERAAIASEGGLPPAPYPAGFQGQYPGAPYPGAQYPAAAVPADPNAPQAPGTSIVPASSQALTKESNGSEGGQS
jgi:hypothetical protein